MALRNVVKMGDDLLRKKSKDVKEFNEILWNLLDDMRTTMHENKGIGLAAPQVGVLKNIFIAETNNMYLEFINPVILYQEGKLIDAEGCLSVEDIRGLVERPQKLTVSAYDRFGNKFTLTCENYIARVICHEFDHLNGVLFVDKMIKEIIPEKD